MADSYDSVVGTKMYRCILGFNVPHIILTGYLAKEKDCYGYTHYYIDGVTPPSGGYQGDREIHKWFESEEEAMLAVFPNWVKPVIVVIRPLAYLRTMWSLLYSAFRHPFKTTEIDATTGRIIRHY